MKIIFLIILFVLLLSSCQKIEEPSKINFELYESLFLKCLEISKDVGSCQRVAIYRAGS